MRTSIIMNLFKEEFLKLFGWCEDRNTRDLTEISAYDSWRLDVILTIAILAK